MGLIIAQELLTLNVRADFFTAVVVLALTHIWNTLFLEHILNRGQSLLILRSS